MATVNGYTAEKMDAILNQTVKSAAVVSGNLILTKYDNTTSNAGSVIGPTGPTGSNVYICTSSTRPSTTTKGYTIYETDTGKLMVYYGSTTGWNEPWGLPWGIIGKASYTSDAVWNGYSGSTFQDTLTTSAGGGTAILNITSATLYANRLYKLSTSMPLFSYGVSTTTKFRVTKGDGTQLALLPKTTLVSNTVQAYSGFTTFSVTATVSATIKIQYLHDSTPACSLAANGSYAEIHLEDIGPNTSIPSA